MTATTLLIAFVSLVLHELAHGWTAYWLGDTTAYGQGRLSFNPLRHVSLPLTIGLPALSLLVTHGTFVVGGGKPVPVNRLRLTGYWTGYLVVVLAGPACNALIAFVSWLFGFHRVTDVNMMLAAVNLLPLPFLDGGNAARAIRWILRERLG